MTVSYHLMIKAEAARLPLMPCIRPRGAAQLRRAAGAPWI